MIYFFSHKSPSDLDSHQRSTTIILECTVNGHDRKYYLHATAMHGKLSKNVKSPIGNNNLVQKAN